MLGGPRVGPRVPAHQVTTRNLGAAYPLVAEAGLGHRGVLVGQDLLGGSFVYDPFELYAQGVISNPNMIVFGQIGRGKSAFVKTYLWRQAVFGRRAWVVDPKGEYGALAAAWGVRPIALRPGGSVRLNPLDPGPDTEVTPVENGTSIEEAAPAGDTASGLSGGPCRRPPGRAAGVPGRCLPRTHPAATGAGGGGPGAGDRRRHRSAVPTLPAVVEAMLEPTAEAAGHHPHRADDAVGGRP